MALVPVAHCTLYLALPYYGADPKIAIGWLSLNGPKYTMSSQGTSLGQQGPNLNKKKIKKNYIYIILLEA